MLRELIPGESGLGLSPGQEHCCVLGQDTLPSQCLSHSGFLGKTLYPRSASPTQEYQWVPANCWGNLTNCGEVTCDGLASSPGGVEILLAASYYRNRDKLLQL